jgi:hypothetical protein
MDIEEFSESIADAGQNPIEELREAVSERVEEIEAESRRMRGHEGRLTKRLERLTSALPSSTWLGLATMSMAGSIALRISGREHASQFVGQWVPTFLLLGIYNKLVKVAGSDRFSLE